MITITHDDIIAYVNDASHDTCSRILSYAHTFLFNMHFVSTCDDDATTLTFDAFDDCDMIATIDELRDVLQSFVACDDQQRLAHVACTTIENLLRDHVATKR